MIPNRPLLILLVEDDQMDVMTILRAFKEAGVSNSLHIAPDGEEAISYLEDASHPAPRLILLDLNMPRMSGLEFLRIAKGDSKWRSIPVVVLTTSDQLSDRQQCYDLSVAGYIVKPMDYSAFVDVVKTVKAYWDINEFAD